MEWILWSPSSETGLLVIPEEAELLIPILRLAGPTSRTHLIPYAAPVTKSMGHFNNMGHFTIPPLTKGYDFPSWFRLELGLFSGRLYASFDECLEIAEYLRERGYRCDTEGTVSSGIRPTEFPRKFSDNPIGFLLEWLALRRQAQDILQTPMGYICRGSKLHPEHPFFTTPVVDDPRMAAEHSSMSNLTDATNDTTDDAEDDENSSVTIEKSEQQSA